MGRPAAAFCGLESRASSLPTTKDHRSSERRSVRALSDGIRSWHRISSEQRGIGANWRFARLVALSAATSRANQPAHARICRYLRVVAKHYRLYGGERRIRTRGTLCEKPPRFWAKLVGYLAQKPARVLERRLSTRLRLSLDRLLCPFTDGQPVSKNLLEEPADFRKF